MLGTSIRGVGVKATFLCSVFCLIVTQSFGQSSTGAPVRSASRPLSVQHLDAIKNTNPEDVFAVKTTNGNTVAEMRKIIVDAQSGQPRFAVLHLYDNVDEHRPFTPVPWEMLKIEPSTRDIVIETSVTELRKAPKSNNMDNYPTKIDANWGQQYYSFYKISPNSVGGSGMLPSGTIKGSDSNLPQADNAGRAPRVFLWSSVAAAVLVFLLLVFNRRRTVE
jgi:hypothetical protein